MPGAEIAAGPEVHAAGTGVTSRQRGHRDGQGNHEEQGGQEPEQQGAGARVCGRRHPADAHDGDDGK